MFFSVIIRSNELVAFSVDIDDFNRIVFLQMLAELGDIHIHAARIEVVVINPDSLERKVTLQNLVGMSAEQAQQ